MVHAQHDQLKVVGSAFDAVRHEAWEIFKKQMADVANQYRKEMGTVIAQTKNETIRALQAHVNLSKTERE
jgi:hypothetical protein